MVKRSMNRAPGHYDRWFGDHQANCGGTFTKVKEPEGFGQKKAKKDPKESGNKGKRDIRDHCNKTFFAMAYKTVSGQVLMSGD